MLSTQVRRISNVLFPNAPKKQLWIPATVQIQTDFGIIKQRILDCDVPGVERELSRRSLCDWELDRLSQINRDYNDFTAMQERITPRYRSSDQVWSYSMLGMLLLHQSVPMIGISAQSYYEYNIGMGIFMSALTSLQLTLSYHLLCRATHNYWYRKPITPHEASLAELAIYELLRNARAQNQTTHPQKEKHGVKRD